MTETRDDLLIKAMDVTPGHLAWFSATEDRSSLGMAKAMRHKGGHLVDLSDDALRAYINGCVKIRSTQ